MTNLENLKKLAENVGADASKCSTNLGALNVISKALGGSGDAGTNAEAIEDIAQAAPAAMEQNVEWGRDVITPTDVVTAVNIPYGVTKIGDGAFAATYSVLASVTIPETVKSIGAGAFSTCTGLTAIEIPASVTSIHSYAFDRCTNLTEINIHKLQDSISGAPWGATNATVTWTG